MSFAFHGNYCGPGWTAGKYMNAEDATWEDFDVPAVDPLDAVCKYHDYMIWQAYKEQDPEKRAQLFKDADRTLMSGMEKLASPGMKSEMIKYAVWVGGPGKTLLGTSFSNLPWDVITGEHENMNILILMTLKK
jgi:hypothetical protein